MFCVQLTARRGVQNNGTVFQVVVELGPYMGTSSYWEPKLEPEMVCKEAVDVV